MGIWRGLPYVVIGALSAAVAGAAWLGASTQLPTPRPVSSATSIQPVPIGGLGGYHEEVVGVRQIDARWRVPTVSPASGPGWAGTWVGAQSTKDSDFVQIGTNEEDLGSPAAVSGRSHPADIQYVAFWSDTALGFHPRDLGIVYAGDQVQVSLTRAPKGWRLRFEDLRLGRTTAFSTTYAAGATLNVAEWTEEDVFDPSRAVDFPYPTT